MPRNGSLPGRAEPDGLTCMWRWPDLHEQKPGPNRRNVGQLTRANAVAVMCDKCVELDKKLEQYRRLASSITDQLTIARLNKLIEDTVAQKAELHPDQKR
jgi:hypothetical protein